MRNGEIHADNDKNDNIDIHSQINIVYVISDLNRKFYTISRFLGIQLTHSTYFRLT